MRQEILILEKDVLNENLKPVSAQWKVMSGVDIFSAVNYNFSRFKKVYFCPDVNLEQPFKSVNKSKNNMPVKYGKNIIYSIDDKEKADSLQNRDLETGSYIIFNGNDELLDLLMSQSFMSIFNDCELVRKLMRLSDFFFELHDNEWQCMCYYRDNQEFANFISFLNEKTKIKFVSSWDDLPS